MCECREGQKGKFETFIIFIHLPIFIEKSCMGTDNIEIELIPKPALSSH